MQRKLQFGFVTGMAFLAGACSMGKTKTNEQPVRAAKSSAGSPFVAPSGEGEGRGGSSVQHTPFTRLPQDRGPIQNYWSTSEPRVLKDRSRGSARELFGFGWPIDGGDTQIYMFKSGDNGQSWSFANPPADQQITNGTTGLLCAAQDSSGKVHVLYRAWGTPVMYARIALAHDAAGAITGYRAEVDGVLLPAEYNSSGDIRAMLQVVQDGTGAERLTYSVADEPTSDFRVTMGSAPLSASSTADFVALDGSPGFTEAVRTADYGTQQSLGLVCADRRDARSMARLGPHR